MKNQKNEVRLRAFSPHNNECSLSGSEHVDFFEYVLDLFGKSFNNVLCIISDNCSTNKSIENILRLPLVGGASHRFNLAMQDILKEEEPLIARIIL